MPGLLTKEQGTFLLKQWCTLGKRFAVDATFRNEYPGEEVPTRQTIHRLTEKFDETGSVEDAPRSGGPITVTTEENIEDVHLVILTFHAQVYNVL